MKFLDRVKNNLSNEYSNEISLINDKIAILLNKMDGISMVLDGIEKEKNFLADELKQLNKNNINSKNIELYEIIFNIKSDLQKIEQITNKLKKASRKNNLSIIDETIYIINLSNIIKELNVDINKIISEDTSQQLTTSESQYKLSFKFLSTFKNILPWNKTSSNTNNYSFRKIMKILNSYENSREELLVFNDALNTFISKSTTLKNINAIRTLENFRRKGTQLLPEDERFLEVCESCKIWESLADFYTLVDPYEVEMKDFFRNSEKIRTLLKHKTNIPETISKYTKTREKIKSKNKDLKDKNKQTLEYKKDLSQINSQLSELRKKKEKLEKKQSELPKASLRELGFKTKKEAIKKLNLKSKDYIVLPIPSGIKDLDNMFDEKIAINIVADNKEFKTFYEIFTANGVVNSCCNITNENAALLVPIYELKEEDIDSLKKGIIKLNKTCKDAAGSFVIAPNGRQLASVCSIRNYSDGSLTEHIKDFLGEDFVKDSSEYEVYGLLRSAPDISDTSINARIEAVNICLFENLNRDIQRRESITVDGELFTLNSKNLISIPNSYEINKNRVNKIISKTKSYLNKKDYSKKSIIVDQIYSELLKEYLVANKKAKAEYYEENNTNITLNNKKFNIKPALPHSETSLAKRYSRKDEDVAYKIIKLANLCNRYAHLTEKEHEENSNKFFELKYALVEAVIDISLKNPDIKIEKKYDEEKCAKAIIVEIPGYSMISLHIINEDERLCYKINRLDKSKINHVSTSAILIGGINENLLLALKNLSLEERKTILLELDSKTFYKFALRMGYTSKDISTPDEKTAFINYMLSDEYINKKLQEEKEENEH